MVFLAADFAGRLLDLASRLFDDGEKELPSEVEAASAEELLTMVDLAKQEWETAQNYFNHATEPALVDHAILSLQAAERKYMYWLDQIKKSE